MSAGPPRERFDAAKATLRRHGLACQAAALLAMLGVPVLLYLAAGAGSEGWVIAWLCLQAAAMALAVAAS